MKLLIYILIAIVLSSCGQERSSEKESDKDIPVVQSKSPNEVKEITEKFTYNNESQLETKVDKPDIRNGINPDFFEISDTQFNQFKEDGSKWFISSDRKSRLYFIPYTDYSITTAILIEKEITDSNLISLLQFEGIRINDLEKTIELDIIQTKKGIKLGLSIDEVKELYGDPNMTSQLNDKDILEWNQVMLDNGESNKVGGLRPFVIDGLEFIAEMEFIDNKLTQVVYKYEVP